MLAEPGDQVGIDAQRNLLFDRPVEQADFRSAPIEPFGDQVGPDLVVGDGGKGGEFRLLFGCLWLMCCLLHCVVFREGWLCGR